VNVGAGLNAIARLRILNGTMVAPNGRQGGHQNTGRTSSGNSGGNSHTINQGNIAKRVNITVTKQFKTKGEEVKAHREAMKELRKKQY
jgi:hypothetical protein